MNILICGVGGQGIILASKLLADAALNAGFDIKQSEVHGMSQRGGSVVSFIRFSEKVYSPLINFGCADFILSFEKLETLRYLDYASKKCKFIIADMQILTSSVNSGAVSYPNNIVEYLPESNDTSFIIDAIKIAGELGNIKTVNTIMLGFLSRFLNIPDNIWEKTLSVNLPEKILELNSRAFSIGRALNI